MTTERTQQTNDTAENAAALARLRPWEPDPRWPVVSSATPPRFTVSLSGPPEAAALFAKARADRRTAEERAALAAAIAVQEVWDSVLAELRALYPDAPMKG